MQGPSASLPRMIATPFLRLFRRLNLPIPNSFPSTPTATQLLTPFALSLTAAIQRLDLSLSPQKTLHKLSKHQWTPANIFPYVFMGSCALFSLYIMTSYIMKLGIPLVYITALLIPATSQFVLPATPIFAWLITFFSARFIPSRHRPDIHVALLPALESVLYGANISDLLTRYTHPFLDVLAWLPYGVLHFMLPFFVALMLWVFGPRGAVQYWGRAFGFMNLLGVLSQIMFPCAAPWYEIIHGLTPANYSMPGSPGGLMRIDRVFHSSGYTNAFGSAPLVFGAFPSLHSGCAVMEALFLSHFFPHLKPLYWTYTGILWWATMYLSHHYLIDLAGGACLSVLVFYLFMPEEFKDSDQIKWEVDGSVGGGRRFGGESYELMNGRRNGDIGGSLDLDLDEEIRKLEDQGEAEISSSPNHSPSLPPKVMDEERRVGGTNSPKDLDKAAPKLTKKRSVSWGETSVLGESSGMGMTPSGEDGKKGDDPAE